MRSNKFFINYNRLREKCFHKFGLVLLLCSFSVLFPSDSGQADPPIAKYVILLISDGLGQNHIEAKNSYIGSIPSYQSDPNWVQSWQSTYPHGGSYDPAQAWSDFDYVMQGYTDSAAAATALYTGVKTQNGRCSVSNDGAERLFSIGEEAKILNRAVGAVSTVPISHATPGVFASHNENRGNTYAIADESLFEDPNTTGLPSETRYGGGYGQTIPSIDVLIGDGRDSYVNSDIKDLLRSLSGSSGNHVLVERQSGQIGGEALETAANAPTTKKLVGLFDHIYHSADDSDYNPENPTLAESTAAALTVLSRNTNGFVLMIEGGAVDWAAHQNNMDLMIGEQIDFDEAVLSVIDWVEDPTNDSNWDNTLVIVTADHETGYLTASPIDFPDTPLGEVNDMTLALEKVVSGSGGRRASWNDLNSDNIIDVGETIYWYWNSGGHTNSLVPIFSRGPGSEVFVTFATNSDPVRGTYVQNIDVHKAMYKAIFGELPPREVMFELSSSGNDEAESLALLNVVLNIAYSQTITVDYAVTGGTATGSGVDYTLAAGTLTFNPNETSQPISLEIIDDTTAEADETIEVTLSNPTNVALGWTNVHTFTIYDDDGGVSTPQLSTGNAGGGCFISVLLW